MYDVDNCNAGGVWQWRISHCLETETGHPVLYKQVKYVVFHLKETASVLVTVVYTK